MPCASEGPGAVYARRVSGSARRRWSRLSPRVRLGILGLGGIIIAWLVGAAVILVFARQSVNAGIARLEDARSRLSPGDLVRGKARDALRDAERDFERAHRLASNPLISALGVVPVLGQQVRSIDAMTGGAADVVTLGKEALDDARARLRHRPQNGAERVELAQRLEAITTRAEQQLRAVRLGPDFLLVGPVADARDRFADRLREVRTALGNARLTSGGTGKFLKGPTRYLVLAANNGEMRAGSGMLLSAGVLTLDGGSFELGPMTPTGELHLPPGAVPATGELAALWGWLHPTEEWRNLATTPRFDVTAPFAAEMWRAATGQTVDGVLALDPLALRALLAAEGPIEAGGRTLTAKDVVDYILLQQYRDFSSADPAQQARRDQLGAVARTAVQKLDRGSWRPPDLVDELSHAGRGRHILAWSRDATEQRGWEAAGVAGRLERDSLLVSVMNLGGNKLDQFLAVDARLDVRDAGGSTDVAVRIHLHNDAPVDAPAYVIGPFPAPGFQAGQYQGIVAVNVPGIATRTRIDGAERLVAAGPDGPTRVVAAPITLDRGADLAVTVRFRLPPGQRSVRVEPSARVPAIHWIVRGRRFVDDRAEHASW